MHMGRKRGIIRREIEGVQVGKLSFKAWGKLKRTSIKGKWGNQIVTERVVISLNCTLAIM